MIKKRDLWQVLCRMDALFSKNVEDKEVYFKDNPNVEGIRQDPLFDVKKTSKKVDKGAKKDNVC